MSYSLSRLTVHIHWMLAKDTYPGWKDIRQTTDMHTLYWIREGRGRFRSGDREFPAGEGMLLYLHPGMELHMETEPEAPLRMLMLLFDCAEASYGDRVWKELLPVSRLELPSLSRFSPEQASGMTNRFTELLRSWVPGVAGSELHVGAGLLKLLADLHGSARDSGTGPAAVGMPAAAAYQQLKNHMELHYAGGRSVRELCAAAGISESYARILFKRQLGIGPKEYLEQIRNSHAIRHLLYSQSPLKDIAQLCGYADEYHFSKVFRRMNGMPPSVYRRNNARFPPAP